MKKNLFKITFVVIFLVAFNACKSDVELDDNLKFTKLSVQEQKQKIEDSGIELVDDMEGMKETEAYKSLTDLLETFGSVPAPQLRQLKSALESRNLKTLDVLNKQMRSVSEIDEDIWGEYVWDEDIEDFDKVSDLTDQLIFRFPSSSSDKSNSAVVTINYDESDVEIPDADQYYPSDVTCVFKIDGKTALKAEFHGVYRADGTPAEAINSLEVGDYKWNTTYKNNTETASEEFEFAYKSKTLIKMAAELKGDLTYNALEDLGEAEEMPDDFITSGNIYFQMMDIAVLGGIADVKILADQIKELDNSTIESDSKEYYNKVADILNENIVLWSCFVDDKSKFADVEFYASEYSDTYTSYDYVWNGSYYEYVESTETSTYYELVPRFILSDGSKVDIEEFFQAGFDDLISRLENAAEDMSDDFDY